MTLGSQDARFAETGPDVILWNVAGTATEVRCDPGVLAEIAELAMSGYRRYPWGGVEIGGLLFGKKESERIHIRNFRMAECEHHYGPAFDFSEKDSEAFGQLLAGAAEDQALSGLLPVGWYHTVSRRDLSLSEHAKALFQRFFPQLWQVAMVIKRSKSDPLSVGISIRDAHGRVEMRSPSQEFTLDALRQRQSSTTVPEVPEEVPPIVSPAPEPPPEPVLSTAEFPPPATTGAEAPAVIDDPMAPARADTPLSFLGLTADPFSDHPDAKFFYPSRQHREALAILVHRIRSHSGFLVMLGEPGTGKSMVLECLKDLLKTQTTDFSFLLNSKISVAEFFELIAHDFRLPVSTPTKTSTLIALNEYLLERSGRGQTTALVVDSAEKLSTEVLEEIELLGNLENRTGRLLQVVFAAQPGFESQLDAPELRSLKQRLMLRARLEPLDEIETAAYIEHRMEKAGASKQQVFPPKVLAEVYQRTQGVPRLINELCAQLLADALANDLALDAAVER